MFNKFVWAGQKARIKSSFLQQRKGQGGVSLPSIEYYYQAAMLEHLLQWWNLLNRRVWEIEQLRIKIYP